MPETKKKKKVNKAFNSYIEPRRTEAPLYDDLQRIKRNYYYNGRIYK